MTHKIPHPPKVCQGFLYWVQQGDTLFNIARRFNITLERLLAANPQIKDPNLIFPGQRICIPVRRPIIECCMLLFRTDIVPPLPDAEAGGVARVFQSPEGGSVLVATIGLPPPETFNRNIYVAWIRRFNLPPIPFQLLQTGPVVIEPGVWVGAFIIGPGEEVAPFQDIIVIAEEAFPVIEPDLDRIVLTGQFEQCLP
ncbi:MAG: LysM domain-containing protein [Candidatus Contubernalis sp.]|nr:LysM domain-containing protein [Candidatus Contubernalis sp.]